MTVASFLEVVVVGIAGSLGSLARYLLGRFVVERVNIRFPLGTFLINISGAFLIGLIFALTAHKVIRPELQLFLATGFLGGYTTFSTMNWEGVQLARGGDSFLSLAYLAGSCLLGLLAATLGLLLGGWL